MADNRQYSFDGSDSYLGPDQSFNRNPSRYGGSSSHVISTSGQQQRTAGDPYPHHLAGYSAGAPSSIPSVDQTEEFYPYQKPEHVSTNDL